MLVKILTAKTGITDFDPLSDRNIIREVELPDGYYRVMSGSIKPGDLFLNAVLLPAGEILWMDVREKYLRAKPGDWYTSAGWYLCLIRESV